MNSKCPWILEHPFYSSNFQLGVLVCEVFVIGMLVGSLIASR